jgi:hypothetical protein
MAARSWASPGASAAWSPGLWTLGLAPASGDDVTIGGSATSYTVTLNIDSPAINSLTLGTNGGAGNATLDVGTHNLNVTGGSSDTITLLGSGLGSHLTIGGGTINANTLNIVSGDITGFGTITATVTVFADASLQASGGTLEVAGAVIRPPARAQFH